MKISVNSIIRGCLYLSILLSLSLIKPLGEIVPVFYSSYANSMCVIIMGVVSFFLVIGIKRLEKSWVLKITTFIVLLFLFRLVIDVVVNKDVSSEFKFHCVYLYIIWAIPVYYLLRNNGMQLNKLLDYIIYTTILSYLLRIFISVYYGSTGIRIFLPISTEYATSSWFRNGILRMNMPCFAGIIIVLCMYQMYSTNRKLRKLLYIFGIALALYFSLAIHCARSLLVYQVIEIIFCIMIKRRSTFKQFFLLAISGIVACVIANIGIIDDFIEMFSATNQIYGDSNSSRIISYAYYEREFSQNFLIGKGLTVDDAKLSDVGILYSSVMLGVGILFFYFAFWGRCIQSGFIMNQDENGNAKRILVWGIGLSTVLLCINIDCFYGLAAFSVPFCIAVTEYVRNTK